VKVTGHLTVRDMRRFEHACAPALTSPFIALEIDLSDVDTTDRAAKLLLSQMAHRGAHITPPANPGTTPGV
jgi:hypothetical protein